MRKDPSTTVAMIGGAFGLAAIYSAGSQPSAEFGGEFRTFTTLAAIAVLFFAIAIFMRMGGKKD